MKPDLPRGYFLYTERAFLGLSTRRDLGGCPEKFQNFGLTQILKSFPHITLYITGYVVIVCRQQVRKGLNHMTLDVETWNYIYAAIMGMVIGSALQRIHDRKKAAKAALEAVGSK
jgi:hypothetical protein